MTRHHNQLHRHSSLALVVIVGLAGAGVMQASMAGSAHAGTPPGRAHWASPPRDDATPHRRRPRHQPPPRTPVHHAPTSPPCALDAAVIFTIDSAPTNDPHGSYHMVRVLSSGAWTVDDGHHQRSGCLSDHQMAELRAHLSDADFTPPPPPRFRCRALPTRTVTVMNLVLGQKAQYSAPCGDPAGEDVLGLQRLVESWVAPSAPPPSPAPSLPPIAEPAPQCRFDGAPIYHEATWRIHGPHQAKLPEQALRVYASGAWRLRDGDQVRTGCLDRRALRVIERRVRRARFRLQAVKGPRCQAIVAEHQRVVTRRGALSWAGPCGDEVPHRSVLSLQRLVRAAIEG
ncbi:hypothetical protein [Haliangium sp.]|uniref:hypothetical protein n=1 Tax=Haliangium sp. TaxID=2663208 RepID=UPI003D09BEA0